MSSKESSSGPADPPHCPYKRTVDLVQRLAPNRMRIAFLLGAGCPLSVRVGSNPLIPDIAGLTKNIYDDLSKGQLKGPIEQTWKRLASRNLANPTIEHALSHIRTLQSVCGKDGIDGYKSTDLLALDAAICKLVRTEVSKTLPASRSPYHDLARWIQAIAREHPVEIFTTNYDLLIEQALEEQGVPYFDGFMGSHTAFLDLESMVEDRLPARWARVWKIHGSVNWWVTKSQQIRRSRDPVEGEQLLIYPSHLKYDQSREMPFYAMSDRLRAFLRSEQCVLVTCGYSFQDEHINALIRQGLKSNPNAACVALVYNDRADVPLGLALARRQANLLLLAADGAVIGTQDRQWAKDVKESSAACDTALAHGALASGRTKAPADQAKWLLGDFSSLGKFLVTQLSSRDLEVIPDEN